MQLAVSQLQPDSSAHASETLRKRSSLDQVSETVVLPKGASSVAAPLATWLTELAFCSFLLKLLTASTCLKASF
jgi:hypothetical protein